MNILIQYLKNYRSLILLALFLAAINQIFSLLDPFVFGLIIDRYVTHFKNYTIHQFIFGGGALICLAMGVAMVSRIAKNFQDYFVNVITQRLGAKIYSDGLAHSLSLPYQVFEDQRSGETLGVLQKVRSDSEKLIQSFVNILFTSIIGILFVAYYSYSIYWVIALVYLSFIPILIFFSLALSKRIKKVQKVIVSETTALAGSTTESLRNIELIKSLGLAEQEIKRLNVITNKILGLELKKVKFIRSISFVQGTLINFLRNSLLFLIMYLIYINKITVGQFFTLFIYSFALFGPLQEIGNIINLYRETQISLINFNAIITTPKEKQPEHPKHISQITNLSFEKVGFKHQSAITNALQDISFHVNIGETIAFVGPSGAGKTTLVKLLVGLYFQQTGQIKYNQISNRELDLNVLRERIGFVTQDTQLFAGTIRENLLFVRPDASDEDCMLVLRQSACGNLLARADKGLDTIIGEGGVKVSGGEKQRLSIARALLRKPEVIVFDEATSSLDSLTEEEITSTIREVSEGSNHITILIAHRLSTIKHADRIYVLERGSVTEQGSHADLIAEKGLYYAMWRQQIGERV